MTLAERSVGQKIPEFANTLRIGASVLKKDFTWDDRPERKGKQAAYRSFTTEQAGVGSNTLEEVLLDLNKIVGERNLPLLPIDYSKPYWMESGTYKPSEIFSTLMNYSDAHAYPLSKEMAPPANDIKKFISEVHTRSADKKQALKIPDLLEIGLDIADNNIVGASHIAFLAARSSARDLEQRLLPEVIITEDDMHAWNRDVAQIQVFGDHKADGPGDLYYFFEHFFGATVLESVKSLEAKTYQAILSKGTLLMTWTREHIAGRPTVTPHSEASLMGRKLGLGYARFIGVNQKPIFAPNA